MRFGLVGLDSPIYSAATRKEVRRALKRVGFSGDSMKVKLRTMERKVPSAKYVFNADEMPPSPQLGCSPPKRRKRFARFNQLRKKPCALTPKATILRFQRRLM
jgi:hypothetical protein